jgi:rhodanese-related sulfurtransferase
MGYARIDPAGARDRLDKDWVMIDVRTVEEYAMGHPAGSYNVPFLIRGPMGVMPNPGFGPVMDMKFARSAKLVLSCATGQRSADAAARLVERGFEHVATMDGGFDGHPTQEGWQQAGYDIELTAPIDHTWDALKAR